MPKKNYFGVFQDNKEVLVGAVFSSLVFFHAVVVVFPRLAVKISRSNESIDVYNNPPRDKVVLFWTKYFSNAHWSDHFARNGGPFVELDALPNGLKRNCFFTVNRSRFNDSDAVVFHGRDLDFADLPGNRLQRQKWIFFLIESPHHSGFVSEQDWLRVNNIRFNWTMSYTNMADVYFPYGYIRPSPANFFPLNREKIVKFVKTFHKRPKDAVWIVSNCFSASVREEIVVQLKAFGINIDIWGNCGRDQPDRIWKISGEKSFFEQYRFYLAFENSLCTDYITEKAFHAFYANFLSGTIPVVYGGGNYGDFFANGSYIDAGLYKNISNLAHLMKSLSSSKVNLTQLLKYYEWQITVNPQYKDGYEIEKKSDAYIPDNGKRLGWMSLCRKLWLSDSNAENVVEDIRTALGSCHGAKFRRRGWANFY